MPPILPAADSPPTRRLLTDASGEGSSCSSSASASARTSVDLVTASRCHLSFLRSLSGSLILHHRPTIIRSVRRYEELWMPLIGELFISPSPPIILPPVDVRWVWHCHCLNPEEYREYCTARFGAVVERPAIFDDENEEYAIARCREIWGVRYPLEEFDMEEESGGASGSAGGGELVELVVKYGGLPGYFSDPFCFETVYIVAARRRYLRFLDLVRGGDRKGMVPAQDVLLIWLTHQVYIFMKGKWEEKEVNDANKTFLRLRTARSHREMKVDRSVSNLSSETWRKTWHLYCEFGTRGIVLEVRRHGNSCLRNTRLIKKVVFLWNDILRSTSLTLTKELQIHLRAMSSITPPVQAPYLLKCVPDRVTDDKGAMISDVILRMNQYYPQQGRWLSRTVLDHATRECFVIRIRVGSGIWRRGAEIPRPVNWEDRIIEVREGAWSYVASSVGSTRGKVVGTAAPVQAGSEEKKAIWSLSTGDFLTIEWENGLAFTLENESSTDSVTLLCGRKSQYQVKEVSTGHTKPEEEQHYITVMRSSPEHPTSRATALINWKLSAVEFLPEEDAVLILLLCTAIVRTLSEIRREDVGGLLVRRRLREVKAGLRDWGSIMQPFPCSSPLLQPWYWNAQEVLASAEMSNARAPTSRYSPADGNDQMYRQVIIP